MSSFFKSDLDIDTLNASGDVTIEGDLTVSGTTTTVSTTNTVVSDRLIELANGQSTGADSGIIIERGSTGNNAAIIWDESADTFVVGTTTATGASTGDLSVTDAAFQASVITASTSLTLASGSTVTAIKDEDNLSSDSATSLATQQSIKAYVDSQVSGSGNMDNWVLEDDDGTEVTVSNGKEVKFIGSGITTNFTDTDNGTDADPYDLTFTVDAAQTGITSILATDVKIGEDDQTKIDFETADQINFYANNAKRVTIDSSGLTIDSGSLETATIDYTDGDLAITIADGGGITAAAGITSTAASNTFGATSFNDADITNVGDIALDSISADGTDINVAVSDNSATALTIKQGSDAYLIVDTANSSESVAIGTGLSGTAISIGHGTSETTVNDNLTVTGASQFNGNANFGVDDTGVDVRIFSATASEGVLYDASQDELGLLLTTKLKFHDIGGGEEIFASADGHLEVNAGTTLDMTAPTVDINASTAITMDSPGVTIASATSQKPVLTVKNETNDNNDPATILILKSRAGNAGVDGDKIGDFIFAGFNNAGTPEQIEFARIKAVIAERDDGAEGGELRLQVASHDGELKSGIKVIDGTAEDQVDVTIGSTGASLTTVEGTMLVDGGTVQFGKGQNAVFAVETTDASTDGRDLTISAGSAPTGSANQNGGDLVLAAGGGDGNGTSIMTFATKTAAADTVAERMRIHTDGNVGIGTNAPSTLLHVAGQQPYLALQNTTDEHTDGGGESNIIFGDHTGQTLALIQGSHSGSSDNDKGKLVLSTNNDSGTQTALTIDDTQKSTFSGQAVVNNRFAAAGPSGTFVTFADGDATPSVATGNLFKHHASTQTITMFDDGIAGQVITVISTAAITYDVTSTNLMGGSTDIVTANGDVTQWAYDGTNWYLMQFMDVSADHSTVGGGGTAANDVNLILHTQVFGR